MLGCTLEQANKIIELRPFVSIDDLKERLGQTKKKAGPAGISPRMFEDCTAIFESYRTVDNILRDCEKIGAQLRAAIASWTHTRTSVKGKERASSETSTVASFADVEDGALHLVTLAPKASGDYLATQPSLISQDVQLKDYQLAGLNWLRSVMKTLTHSCLLSTYRLLYRKKLSCILADEMGEFFLLLSVYLLLV
jgi:SWI/SNF-related matrix-associated actin-dependent regulator of chromatin subfamily A containing DEAD/H box 1